MQMRKIINKMNEKILFFYVLVKIHANEANHFFFHVFDGTKRRMQNEKKNQ